MENKIKNTLDGLFFSSQRRSGNSTKQVDLAIDLLFDGHEVVVLDHYTWGQSIAANKLLFRRILKRIETEHQFSIDDLILDESKLSICLNKEKQIVLRKMSGDLWADERGYLYTRDKQSGVFVPEPSTKKL